MTIHEREFWKLPSRNPEYSNDFKGGYDALEISPVHEWTEKDGSITCEAIDRPYTLTEEETRKIYYGLYGHLPGIGVQHIGDFRTYEEALQVVFNLFPELEA